MRHIQVVTLIICCYLFQEAEEIIQNSPGKTTPHYKVPEKDIFISKVSLTQNGYIQFLKYIDVVPQITDYTFCIWLRSSNLTHNHPILSYSKHEEERLIRVWIGPFGKNINLEIQGTQVFNIPANFIENRWYHVCQSWSSFLAIWALYINGKSKSTGSEPKLRGSFIKGGGDIVVGQEYTDFDKGLDDGIEGDITGFNFVLSSTIGNQKHFNNSPFRRKYNFHQQIKQPQVFSSLPKPQPGLEDYKTLPDEESIEAEVTGYANLDPKRNPKGILDVFRNIFQDEPPRVRVVQKYPPTTGIKVNNRRSGDKVSYNEIGEVRKSLGLLLVELSFDCGYRKGAPVSGKGVLINWNQSPVRVFGGAILKSIPAFCYAGSGKHV